jgi:phosphate transport system protein
MSDNRKTFDKELLALKTNLLSMGKHVEEAIEKSVISLVTHDTELADKVINHDKQINNMQKVIDNQVINLITQQQPVAKDLRKVITSIKINASLERMGDLAKNIAKIANRLETKPSEAVQLRIKEMSVLIQKMVHDILHAFNEEDEVAAKKIAMEDDKVDNLYKLYLNYLLCSVNENNKTVEFAIQLAFAGRHLERIGDHVTNIAEQLVYLEEAKQLNLNK